MTGHAQSGKGIKDAAMATIDRPFTSTIDLWLESYTTNHVDIGPTQYGNEWKLKHIYLYPPVQAGSACSYVYRTKLIRRGVSFNWGIGALEGTVVQPFSAIHIQPENPPAEFPSWTNVRVRLHHSCPTVNSAVWTVDYVWDEW